MAEEDEVTPAQRTLTRDPVTGAPVSDVPPPVTRTSEADEIRRS
jgi:hypothetical protein